MTDLSLSLSEGQDAFLGEIQTVESGSIDISRYEPANLRSLMVLSKWVAASGFCPNGLAGKPRDVALILMRGAELGLTTMTSLQNLHAVYGKVSMSADLIRSLCQRHESCELFEVKEASPTEATVEVQKKGWKEAREVTFTFADAKRAGLVRGGSAWEKWPEEMCVARATTRAARRYFPEVAAGLYSVDELRDEAADERIKNVTPQTQATEGAVSRILGAKGNATERAAEQAEDTFAPPAEPEDFEEAEVVEGSQTVARIPDQLRRELIKNVRGVGAKVLEGLEEKGATSIKAIYALGKSGLTGVSHVGPETAGHLLEYCSARIDESHRAAALEAKDEVTEEAAPEEAGGEPEFVDIPFPPVKQAEVATISERQAQIIRETFKRFQARLEDPERAFDFEDAFTAFLSDEIGVAGVMNIPVDRYGEVQGWLSKNQPVERRTKPSTNVG